VRAYYRFSGGLNGGTAASVVHTIESGRSSSMGDPFLLDPPLPHSERQRERSRDVRAPRFDAELGGWTGPFVVATTNTRVVRRSAALHALWGEPYGSDFVYQEYWRHGTPLRAAAVTGGLGLFYAALRWPPTRHLVKRLLPEPGTGPSEASMDRGWFDCSLLGIAADGRRAWARIHHAGDPSNRATVRFACESALALALEGDVLPGGPGRGGVLTPATGLGLRLAERLRAAGVAIEVGVAGPGEA
jgi:short subunit dehydrogenase-like uncharacterized protein